MIENNVDLVFTVTTPATKKAYSVLKQKGIPVVFSLYDPVSGGVIKSLTNPGENITGVQIRGSVSKALDWLLRFSPEIKNIFVPVKFDSPATKLSLSDLQKAADIKGITLFVHELSSSADIKKAFENNPDLPNLLLDPVFKEKVEASQVWRESLLPILLRFCPCGTKPYWLKSFMHS